MNRGLADFRAFLDEIGITQAQMDAAASACPPPLDLAGDRMHRVLPSAIEGLGVFSGGQFEAGGRVCTLRIGEQWTVCGRYINHDPEPNTSAVTGSGNTTAVATREIRKGDEITLDYRQVMDALERR